MLWELLLLIKINPPPKYILYLDYANPQGNAINSNQGYYTLYNILALTNCFCSLRSVFYSSLLSNVIVARYPGMNLGVHCGVLKNKAYPMLFSCGGIGTAINACHRRGIKVLLGIQGKKGPGFLVKPGDGKVFATRIWDLFLGGHNSKGLRPFGR